MIHASSQWSRTMKHAAMCYRHRRRIQCLLLLCFVASAASLAFLVMLTSVSPAGAMSPGLVHAARFVPRTPLLWKSAQRNWRSADDDPGLCSVSGSECERSSTTNRARNVSAQAVAAPPAETKAWWKAYPHLWVEVTTEDAFVEAINDHKYDLVLVGT